MNKFLKDLMVLADELNKTEGFNCVMVINEMELLYDKHVAELKKLDIPDVSVCDDTKVMSGTVTGYHGYTQSNRNELRVEIHGEENYFGNTLKKGDSVEIHHKR